MKHGRRVQLSVSFSQEIATYVEDEARRRGIPRTWVVQEAVSAHREFRKAQLMREGYEEMHPRQDREELV